MWFRKSRRARSEPSADVADPDTAVDPVMAEEEERLQRGPVLDEFKVGLAEAAGPLGWSAEPDASPSRTSYLSATSDQADLELTVWVDWFSGQLTTHRGYGGSLTLAGECVDHCLDDAPDDARTATAEQTVQLGSDTPDPNQVLPVIGALVESLEVPHATACRHRPD